MVLCRGVKRNQNRNEILATLNPWVLEPCHFNNIEFNKNPN